MPYIGEAVAVWLDDRGVPERLVWNAERYRVSDEPTLVEVDWAAITHPPAVPPLWRFQGSSERGDTRVFDVRFDIQRGVWQLLRTYD